MRAGWALVAVVTIGCEGKNDEGGDVVMADANNFTYVPTIVLGDIDLQAGSDVLVDWTDLDTDIRDRPMDPTLVERVYVIEFVDITKEDLTEKIEKNELFQSDTGEQFIWDNGSGETSVNLSEFAVLGNQFVPAETFLEDPSRVWVVSLINVVNDTNDVLQSKFLTPLDAATETTAELTNDCTTLDVVVDMTSPPPVPLEGGEQGKWRADWSALTTDVNGHDFDPLLATQLQIARFDAASVEEVEAVFLQLDTEAEEFYRMDVFGSTGADDLTEAVDVSTGDHFGGFTTEGVWIVALGCGTCLSPAPLYLAVVDVQ
jgi:hypothetical protein